MTISATIKKMRVERGWSQEQLAEKLGVSRQAVTKWETGAGAPDIANLAALARLFGTSIDELVFDTPPAADANELDRYVSVTSVDVPAEKHYDIKVGCAHAVTLRAAQSEKVAVRLAADSIADLERAFKVIIDTEGRNFDLDVQNMGIVADALARKELDVTIELPEAYLQDAEIELSADELHVEGANLDLEVGGKVGKIWLANVKGHVELDVPIDLEVWANDLRGCLDVNQVGATSVLHLAPGTSFATSSKSRLGRRTIRFTHNGEPAEVPEFQDAALQIELAGTRCELTVDTLA